MLDTLHHQVHKNQCLCKCYMMFETEIEERRKLDTLYHQVLKLLHEVRSIDRERYRGESLTDSPTNKVLKLFMKM
jgi:hypothetical protein